MPQVTGIGGVFFKANDPEALTAWYQEHLGMPMSPHGVAVLRWPADTAEDKGATAWKVAAADTTWFEPSASSFMINYRVDDLLGMIENLKRAGVAILKEVEFHENGKFASVMDPEGNRIELWEPKIWDDKNKQG